eukprot:359663-Lingulodinium_polyedra.AAC.1
MEPPPTAGALIARASGVAVYVRIGCGWRQGLGWRLPKCLFRSQSIRQFSRLQLILRLAQRRSTSFPAWIRCG